MNVAAGVAFADVRRLAEQMQRIAESVSPATERLIRDQERWQSLIDSLADRMLRHQERWEALFRPPESLLRAQQALQEAIDPSWLCRLSAAARVPDLLSKRMQDAAARSDRQFAGLGEIMGEISQRIAENTRIADLPFEDFARRMQEAEVAREALTQRLHELETAPTAEQREDLVGGLLDALIRWVRALPASILSRAAVRYIVQFFLVIILPQLQWASDRFADAERDAAAAEHQSEDEAWQAELEAKLEDLAQAISALARRTSERPILETARPTPLRAAPHRDGRRLSTIPPCTMLEQVEQQGHWLRVIFLDLKTGSPQTGWVYKRSLLRLELWPEEVDNKCPVPAGMP